MTVKAFTVVPTRSGVLRAVSEREVLDLFNARLAAISLSGFIFFGSSVNISDQARAHSEDLAMMMMMVPSQLGMLGSMPSAQLACPCGETLQKGCSASCTCRLAASTVPGCQRLQSGTWSELD